MDPDVQDEGDLLRKDAKALLSSSTAAAATIGGVKHAIKMFGLRKVYDRGSVFRKRPFVAVDGNWLGVHEGTSYSVHVFSIRSPYSSVHLQASAFAFSVPMELVNRPLSTVSLELYHYRKVSAEL